MCHRCRRGPSCHEGHQRQDPNCLLHGCTSQNKKDIQQAVRKALESSQTASVDPSARGVTSTTTTSSTTRTSPPSPPPTEAKPRGRHRSRAKAKRVHESPPNDDPDGEDASEALISDPLQELFGIQSSKGEPARRDERRKPRTPVRYFASPPAELTPPPLTSTSTASRGTTSLPEPSANKMTANMQADEPTPKWVLPELPRSKTSRIIRGLSPIEAGAARAIPAPTPTTTTSTSSGTKHDSVDNYETTRSACDTMEAIHSAAMENPPTMNNTSTDDMPNTGGPHHDADVDSQPFILDSPSNTASSTRLDNKLGATPTAGASGTTIQSRGPQLDLQPESSPSAGESVIPTQDLPGHVRAILEPLPPGWVQGQGFTKGLHPSADVFEVEEDQPHGAPQQGVCDKGDETVDRDPAEPKLGEVSPCENRDSYGDFDPEAPRTSPVSSEQDGAGPDSAEYRPGEEDGDEQGNAPVTCDKGSRDKVPEPIGVPTKLTAQQRARLHELLRTRDSEGRVPYGLDRCADDASMWAAYRQGMKAEYRALRKRKRAAGTWDKDDNRGWGPSQRREGQQRTYASRERQPLLRQRERSPLPRKRTAASSR